MDESLLTIAPLSLIEVSARVKRYDLRVPFGRSRNLASSSLDETFPV